MNWNLLFFRIDRRKKLTLAFLLKSMGLENETILKRFYNTEECKLEENEAVIIKYNYNELKGELNFDLIDAETGKKLLSAGERLTNRSNKDFEEKKLKYILVPEKTIQGKFLATDIYNEESGEIYAEAGDEIDEKVIEILWNNKVVNFSVLVTSNKSGPYIRYTIILEKDVKRAEALAAIYKIMRPGEPPTEESSEKLFFDLFFARIEASNSKLDLYSSSSFKRCQWPCCES